MAGRKSSNRGSQFLVSDIEKQTQPNHNKQQTGGRSSVEQEKTSGSAVDRNKGIASEKLNRVQEKERSFNLVVDDVPYLVKATPFLFNGEVRFYISINGGDEHVFTWDSELLRLRGIDDNSSVLPEALEEAISQKLQSLQP